MSRSAALVVVMIGLVFALAGCSGGNSAPHTPDDLPSGAAVGEAVQLDEGLSVALVSTDASSPPLGSDGTTRTGDDGPWLQFDLVNASEATVAVPSRPVRPTLTDASGKVLEVASLSAGLSDGGGGWGPAAAHRGAPYLNPDSSMRMLCSVPGLKGAALPVVITYAPTRGKSVTFVVE